MIGVVRLGQGAVLRTPRAEGCHLAVEWWGGVGWGGVGGGDVKESVKSIPDNLKRKTLEILTKQAWRQHVDRWRE